MTSELNRGKSAGRPLRMLKALMTGDRLDANSAATRFGVKRAMALRDLQMLYDLVPGVVRDTKTKPHVFRFDDSASARREGQTSVPVAIAASLGAAFSPLFSGTRYQQELEKLRRSLVERLNRRKQDFASVNRKFVAICGREEVLDEQAGLLDDVVDAILGQCEVELFYRRFEGLEEQVRVQPYSLAIYDSHLYVVGAVVAAEGTRRMRPFRFARIRKLALTKKVFAYPEPNEYDPDVLFRDSIGIWLSDPQPCRVRVRLTSFWAVYAQHHRWHQSQQVSKLSDGSVELELRVRPCPELEQWVLRFGENAEVLEPPEFRANIAKRLRTAADSYGKSTKRASHRTGGARGTSRSSR